MSILICARDQTSKMHVLSKSLKLLIQIFSSLHFFFPNANRNNGEEKDAEAEADIIRRY